MHSAVCSECGEDCEIPFKPTGNRPVFCSNCFSKQNSAGRPSRFSDDRRSRPQFEDRQMYEAVCDKCKQNCQVPFRPTAGKPVFCDDCFGKNLKGRSEGRSDNRGSGDMMGQLKSLNNKIDKLIELLSPKTADKEDKKAEETKKLKTKKPTKKLAKAKKVSEPKIAKESVSKKTVKKKK